MQYFEQGVPVLFCEPIQAIRQLLADPFKFQICNASFFPDSSVDKHFGS